MVRRVVSGTLVCAFATMVVVGAVGPTAHAIRDAEAGWTTYRNARHGFMIAYPASVFPVEPARDTEEGQVLVSHDGVAKLMMTAFINEDRLSLADFRRQLLAEEFAGVALDYAPVKDRWFVLSGVRDGTMYYERVTFTCGGRLINTWAMRYPATERKRYDRVVEAVAKTYVPGAGRDGRCE